jgi:hypothetical protein
MLESIIYNIKKRSRAAWKVFKGIIKCGGTETDEMGVEAIAFRRAFSMKGRNDDDAQIIFPLSTQTSHRL